MPLHFTREAYELTQFRLKDTGELVEVQSRFIVWMSKLVKFGEANAITVTKALKAMDVTNNGTHQRQWRHAADFWQEEGVFVGATTRGYFMPLNEVEKARCITFRQTVIDGLERRKKRWVQLPLGKGFHHV